MIPVGASWRYLDNGTDQGTAWRASSFNDSAWSYGAAELGFGDGPVTTLQTGRSTYYFRRTFSVYDLASYSHFTGRINRDDGVVIYVNGQEVCRQNMPAGTINYSTLASSAVGGSDETKFFPFTLSASKLVEGVNVVAVEVHQSAINSSDLTFNLELTGYRPKKGMIIPSGSTWSYLDNGTDQGTAWRDMQFNDSAWAAGPGVLGYGDSQATILSYGPSSSNKYKTTYFRKKFIVNGLNQFSHLTARVKRDDGVVLFLNGQEIYRKNLPASPATINYQTLATVVVNEGDEEEHFYPFVLSPSQFVEGDNVLAAEIHQVNVTSTDISFDFELFGNFLCQSKLDVALVLDHSSSMDGQPLIDAKAGATLFANALDYSKDQASIVSFDYAVEVNAPLTDQKTAILQGIADIQESYDSRVDLGLVAGQAQLAGSSNTNAIPVIILLSDGKPESVPDTLNAAQAAKNAGSRIIVVGFGDVDQSVLSQIASSPQDRYYAADSSELENIFYAIAVSLCRAEAVSSAQIGITSPAPGLIFQGAPTNIRIVTDAPEDGSVEQVQFYQNAVLKGTVTEPPFEWLLEGVNAGQHQLQAVLLNVNGQTANSAVHTVTVNPLPTLSWYSPADGVILQAPNYPVTLNVIATDSSGGSIANVKFYRVDTGVQVGSTVTTPINGNQYAVSLSNYPPGVYPVYAVATDNSGGTAMSSVRHFKVNATGAFESVSITSPVANQHFVTGASVTVTANASDNNGVTSVEFFANGESFGIDTTAPYAAVLEALEPGSYQLIAKATDTLGFANSSTAITIVGDEPVVTSGDGRWDANFGSLSFHSGHNGYYGGLSVDANGNVYGGMATTSSSKRLNIWSTCNWTPQDHSGGFVTSVFDVEYWNSEKLVAGNLSDGAQSVGIMKVGSPWTAYGTGLGAGAVVYTIEAHRGELYIGGTFTIGGVTRRVAKLVNGVWQAVGPSNTQLELAGAVRAIAFYNGELHVGGEFTQLANSTALRYFAKLNSSGTWEQVGPNLDKQVKSLAVSGDRLFAGGSFTKHTISGVDTEMLHVALWNGTSWSPIGRGLDVGESSTEPAVNAIVVRGNELFVGGHFKKAKMIGQEIDSQHVARAVWDDITKEWTWFSMAGGIYSHQAGEPPITEVRAMTLREVVGRDGYDVIVGGRFTKLGSASGIESYNIARWLVGEDDCAGAPSVALTQPNPDQAMLTWVPGLPQTLRATATPNAAGATILPADVQFFVDGVLQNDLPGNGVVSSPQTGVYELSWLVTGSSGPRRITAVAKDSNAQDNKRRSTSSADAYVWIDSLANAHAPDEVVLFVNDPPQEINVLSNDPAIDEDGAGPIVPQPVTYISEVRSMGNYAPVTGLFDPVPSAGGSIEIAYNNASLIYTPKPNTYGTDLFVYKACYTKFHCPSLNINNTGKLTVHVRAKPQVAIVSTSPVTAEAYDADGSITTMVLYENGVSKGAMTPGSGQWTHSWTPPTTAGHYVLQVRATDNHGYQTDSEPVTLAVNGGTADPVVAISGLENTVTSVRGLPVEAYPVIRDGLYPLAGTADDPNADTGVNAVTYQVALFRPDEPNKLYLNVTPGTLNAQSGFRTDVPLGITGGALGTLNLTTAPNGIYELRMTVRSGGEEVSQSRVVSIDNNLKVGQFTFSEQDLVIPVNGIPLTVVRTYDSFNPVEGELGHSWSLAVNDLDVVLDEERTVVLAEENLDSTSPNDGSPVSFSLREGGGRNVTLTLPDGQRATFIFNPQPAKSEPGDPRGEILLEAAWDSPPGVNATLTVSEGTNPEILAAFTSVPYWLAGGLYTPFDHFDIPGYTLTLRDGTKFHFERGAPAGEFFYQHPSSSGSYHIVSPTPGKPQLASIEQRTGDRIVFDRAAGKIEHLNAEDEPTRAIVFVRDEKGRVKEIYDPIEMAKPVPATRKAVVKYVYNNDTGNLVEVHRLMDRNAGTYLRNRYFYTDPRFPHYLTAMEDARGIRVSRQEFDQFGRLEYVRDLDGNAARLEHDVDNKVERVYDREGNLTRYHYDARGNVEKIVDALNRERNFDYDDNGYMTAAWDGPVATGNRTDYGRNEFGDVTHVILPHEASEDPLKFRTDYTYADDGQLEKVTLPSGGVVENSYNEKGQQTSLLAEGVKISETLYVDPMTGLPRADALPTAEKDVFGSLEFAYDPSGNGDLTAMTDSLGQETTSEYDENGQLTELNSPAGASAFEYDALGRETAADYGANLSISYEHDSQLDWNGVSGPTLGSMERRFDDHGRLNGWNTTSGANPGFAYDVNGRLRYETNTLGIITEYTYNDAGELTKIKNLATNTDVDFTYWNNGRKKSEEDALGKYTEYDYFPDGSLKTLTVKDSAQGVIQRIWNYSYDTGSGCCGGGGASSTVEDPLNRTSTDLRSNLGVPLGTTRISGALTRTTSVAYPPEIVSPDQEAEQYPQTLTDEGGRTRELRYNPYGQLEKATELRLAGAPAVAEDDYYLNVYDIDGNGEATGKWLKVQGPPVAIVGGGTIREDLVSFEYDDWDREKTISYAGLFDSQTSLPRKKIFYYEDEKASLDPAQSVTDGAAHLPYKIDFPSGDRVEFAYEPGKGRIQQRRLYKGANLEERAEFTYDAADRIDSVTDTTAGTPGHLTDYVFETTTKRFAGIDFPAGTLNGARLRYEYDALDRIKLVKVKPTSGGLEYPIGYEYDIWGNVKFVKVYNPNSPTTVIHTTEFTHDELGRMVQRKHDLTTDIVTTYSYKIPVAGVPPGSWTAYSPDDFVTHIDHTRATTPTVTPLSRLTYERNSGGEPQKITYNELSSGNWNAGTTVTLNYVNGLRLGTEDWSAGTDVSYTYDKVGNRRTRVDGTGTATTSYDPGFMIDGVSGSSTESYVYDAGGRVQSLTQNSSSKSFTWTASDRLKTVAIGAVTTTYQYDPMGRRTHATRSVLDRRFVVGPTAGTGLEVTHLVTDAAGAVKALYVYWGDQPLIRFTVDGSGVPTNPVYYLEDAMDSVVALVDGAGNTTRFTYDAFGRSRGATDPASSITFPTGTGGDFRYHGMWLEADTGLYHMRARDYDPVQGRFLSRDPLEGATTSPESYHVYNFADSNPHFFSDPTGEFSLIELNAVNAKQFTLQTFKNQAVSYAKRRAQDQLTDGLSSLVQSQFASFFGNGWIAELRNLVGNATGGFDIGRQFGNIGAGVLCKTIGQVPGMQDQIHQHVRVSVNGSPLTSGFNCSGLRNQPSPTGLSRGVKYGIPDFIIGDKPIESLVGPTYGTAFTVGEFKWSAVALHDDYASSHPRKPNQFSAITSYAQRHTFTRTALFVVGHNVGVSNALFPGGKTTKGQMSRIKAMMGRTVVGKGVVPAVVILVD